MVTMNLTPPTVLLVAVVLASSLMRPAMTNDEESEARATKKYKFLLFASIVGGSHYVALSRSGRALAGQGHRVVSLVSSSNSNSSWERDADLFSFVIFNSSYTKENSTEHKENLGKVLVRGALNSFWGPYINSANLTGRLNLMVMWLRECDDLFGDAATMARLRSEKFDMLVADDYIPCGPMLAQALGIPFIHNTVFFPIPSKHGHW